MTQPEQIRRMVADTEERFGPVDILVNNAGIQFVAPVDALPDDKWSQILAINLTSNFPCDQGRAARHEAPQPRPHRQHRLRARPGGRALQVGLCSGEARRAGPDEDRCAEVAETGITCNAVCPGYVRTPLVEGQIEDQARAHGISDEQVVRDVILASQPNKRFVELQQLADLVLFLCSGGAASITGAAVPMDGGGWTAG